MANVMQHDGGGGSSAPYVAQGDGTGLINPALFPKIDTVDLVLASMRLRRMGNGVKDEVEDIATEWDKLPAVYEAPEGPEIYAMLDPAEEDAQSFRDIFDKAAGYIDDFADDLRGIRPRLNDLKKEAEEFRASVINGVEVVDYSTYDPYGYGYSYSYYGAGEEMPTTTVPWYDHQPSLTRNSHLLGRLNEILAEISTAEVDCANDINGLLENSCVDRYTAVTAQQLHQAEDLPWGYKREYQPKNCAESAALGLADVVVDTAQGFGSLVLGYDPETGEFFQGDAYAQAWGGLGDFALSAVVTLTPLTHISAALQLGGVDNEFTQWVDERNKVAANAITSIVNINLYAENPFEAWQEDGVRALFNSAGNIGTFFIPAANVGKLFVAGSTTGRVASIVGALADVLGPGGSFVVKGLVEIVGFGDNAVALADDVIRVADDAIRVSPMSGLDDVINSSAFDAPNLSSFDAPSLASLDMSGFDLPSFDAPNFDAPSTSVFDGPSSSVFDGPSSSVFDGPSTSAFDGPGTSVDGAGGMDTPTAPGADAPTGPAPDGAGTEPGGQSAADADAPIGDTTVDGGDGAAHDGAADGSGGDTSGGTPDGGSDTTGTGPETSGTEVPHEPAELDSSGMTNDEIYEFLRPQTPTAELRDLVNSGPHVDPIYPDLQFEGRLQADHIYPLRQIVEMPRFDELSLAQMTEIANLPENFWGLERGTNASKGAKTLLEWMGHSGREAIPDNIRQMMADVHQGAVEALQEAINSKADSNLIPPTPGP